MPARSRRSPLLCTVSGFLLLCIAALAAPAESSPAAHSFTVSGNQFLWDGHPYQIIAGEMHYPRVPRAYWRDRFRKARAMGLNTITTYVFWNVHEPRPGVYDFSGQNDVAEYIREAQQEGLHVILRPGPYVCAEWEFGGYPAWLLKDRDLKLRANDPKFLAAMDGWFARLSREITPLLLRNGGPIIAVQVENEYGSFGNDHAYMEAVKSALIKTGMAPDLLYTADGAEHIADGSLPELPAVVNFGSGDAQKGIPGLKKARPNGPVMNGEYWAGWFDYWGSKHQKSDGAVEKKELEWMLQSGYSVNIYMFHGGTNFGWMNGANSHGTDYLPDTTSYDYDAPLDEQGLPTEKYYAFRDAITRVTGATLPPIPASAPAASFPLSIPTETASLWDNLPKPIESATLLTMEDLDQSYGYILYRTELQPGQGGELVLGGLHDYAQIYVDQKLIGTLDRRIGTSRLTLPVAATSSTLDILVENTGRVNFSTVIRGERKGLTGDVTLAGRHFADWKIYSLPFDNPAALRFVAKPCTGPCFYRSRMTVTAAADSYLDMRNAHKGELWLNSRPLGRFWNIGPQYTLLVPGAWLLAGANDILFFDSLGEPSETVKSVDKPVFAATALQRD